MKKRIKIILLIAGAALLIICGIFLGKLIFVFSCMSSDTVRDIEKYIELSGAPYSVYPAFSYGLTGMAAHKPCYFYLYGRTG